MWDSFSKLLAVGCWLLTVGCSTAWAQQPVVNPDHSVTFTVKAPGVKKMVLVLSEKKYKMERQGDTFTYHTVSLPSEMYTYDEKTGKLRIKSRPGEQLRDS